MKKILFMLIAFLPLFILKAGDRADLKFRADHRFRIVQFTDIHYKVHNANATKALQGLGTILDQVKPDLVFFTGDIVTDEKMQQAWDEVLTLVTDRKIPWAVVFGNHDDEQCSSRAQIMSYITSKPFCYASSGPADVKGVGNYFLRIKNSDGTQTAAILYGLDSNAYCKNVENESYGYFDFSQVNWYRTSSRGLTAENNGNPYPALAFFHIPLREYGLLNDSTKYKRIGNRNEKECYGALNTGMYAAMHEAGDVMGTFVGHDHDNDYIGRLNQICLAYGRFSGSATTYGKLTNGARIIDLKENKTAFV
ncbi:MAG TPA: metallophosphoesterase family protein, partial [Paludibacter sp.]|nr:metallophosphoesterase family protein [Paludibacter sp.]